MSSCTETCNQGRACTCVITANSDGTSPHDDVFSIVEILLVIVVLSSLTFCLSMLAGFFWSK